MAFSDEERNMNFVDYEDIRDINFEEKIPLLSSWNENEIFLYLRDSGETDTNVILSLFVSGLKDENLKLNYIKHCLLREYKYLISLIPYLSKDESLIDLLRFLALNFEEIDPSLVTFIISYIKFKKNVFYAVLNYGMYADSSLLNILNSIDDDEGKLKLIEEIEDKDLKLRLVCSLKDDELKEFYLDDFTIEDDILNILSSIKRDDIKLDIIRNSKSQKFIITVAHLLELDESRRDALSYIDDFGEKVQIVRRFKSDIYKLSFLVRTRLPLEVQKEIIISLDSIKTRRLLLTGIYNIRGKRMYSENFVLDHDIYDAKRDALPEEMTFGSEIEAEDGLAEIIRACGGKLLNKWKIENDGSLHRGVEFISPIHRYNYNDLNQIYNVCEFANLNGLDSTESCGGHLHFGSAYLDTIDAWFWLFYIYSACEKIFYLISNEEGLIPRENVEFYAMPVSLEFIKFYREKNNYADLNDYIKNLQDMFVAHYQGINISNIGGKCDTIEFRIPNGTLDSDTIVQNILLFGNLLRLAKKLSRLPIDETTYQLLYTLDSDREEEKLEILLKLLFKEEKNREVFRKRFKLNEKLYKGEGNRKIERSMDRLYLKSENICI